MSLLCGATVHGPATDDPSVTVVIPTRDRPDLLRRTLASVLVQRVPLEVVIVDEASSPPVGDALGDVDPRVRIVRHDRPAGVARARNAGTAAARAPWVALLDDDDLWAPDKLQAQLGAAADAGARWAYSDAIVVDEAGAVLRIDRGAPGEQLLRVLLSENRVPAGASNVLVKRDLLREVGGFDETMSHFADWDLWLRLASAAVPVHVPAADVAYVHHASNMHLVDIRTARRELRQLGAKARELTGEPFRAAPALDWIATAHARAGRPWTAAGLMLRVGVGGRSPRLLGKGLEQIGIGARILRPREPVRRAAPPWADPTREAPTAGDP